jgi:hypothetical protein
MRRRRRQRMHNGAMAGSIAVDSSHFMHGKYQDLRDKSRYHTDAQCPIGKKIPGQFVHPGSSPNARLCKTCASGGVTPAAPDLHKL